MNPLKYEIFNTMSHDISPHDRNDVMRYSKYGHIFFLRKKTVPP